MPWDAAFESAYASSVISLLAAYLLHLAITEIGNMKNVGKNVRSLADRTWAIQHKLDHLGGRDETLTAQLNATACVQNLTKFFYETEDLIDGIKLDIMIKYQERLLLDDQYKVDQTCRSNIASAFLGLLPGTSHLQRPPPPLETQVRRSILSSLSKWGLPHKIRSHLDKVDELEKELEKLIPQARANQPGKGATTSTGAGVPVPIASFSSTALKKLVPERQTAKATIIEKLIQGTGVSIGGMAGLGKTILARSIQRNKRIRKHFDRVIWASLPGDLLTDNDNITFEEIKDYDVNGDQVQSFGKSVINLDKRKTLLVLDGLGQVHYRPWNNVLSSATVTSHGEVTVLITTRNLKVASDTGTTHYLLQLLSDQACKQLILDSLPRSIQLKYNCSIGCIAEKCAGLPLVADVLGQAMGSGCSSPYEDPQLVISLFESTDMWKIEVFQEQILPYLRFHEILEPLELNRFLAYFSLFPLCQKFKKNELTQLWMAEGFIQPEEWNNHCILNAIQIFDKLLSKSVLCPAGHVPAGVHVTETPYQIHEFTLRLAQSLARDKCFQVTDDGTDMPPGDVRHLSVHKQHLEPSYLENTIRKHYKLLRTFLLLHEKGTDISQVPESLFHSLELLRVLNLGKSGITELPKSISNLKHLRYLDASDTKIKTLPDTICKLLGLRIIKLKRCRLLRLPQDIGNLVNLILLDIDMTCLHEPPSRLGRLTKLRSLDTFIVKGKKGQQISELSNLNDLQGSMRIIELENVTHITHVENARLKDKPNLKKLELQWTEIEITSMREQKAVREILEQLQPHRNMSELRLTNYRGDVFPSWLSSRSSCHLNSIHLYNCPVSSIENAQFWKLKSLRTLTIDQVEEWVQVGYQFFGDSNEGDRFTNLEYLEFSNMDKLVTWERMHRGEVMPRLRSLKLVGCPRLSALPRLTHLTRLSAKIYIERCPNLVVHRRELPPDVTYEII